MRILHAVEFYSPSVGGAQEVVRQISRRLAARGHDVTVATSADPRRRDACIEGVTVAPFKVSGNRVNGLTGEVEAYRRFVATGGFDVVMIYAAQQWTCDALLDVLPNLACAKVFAPCGFSGLKSDRYKAYFDEMPALLRQFDRLIFHSATYQDHRFAEAHGLLDRSVVVPNGCGRDEFAQLPTDFRARHGIAPDEPLMVTVGSHTGIKGHAEAIETLLSRHMPPATLVIIGNALPGLGGCRWTCQLRAVAARLVAGGRKRVLLLDPPRRDVLAAYQAADIFLFLSNVECSPLVLFEAAASETPFVTADVGNAREIAEWTGGGVVVPTESMSDGRKKADTAAAARLVADMLAHPEQAAALGRSGRRHWMESFSWETIAEKYEAVYRDAIATRLPGDPARV